MVVKRKKKATTKAKTEATIKPEVKTPAVKKLDQAELRRIDQLQSELREANLRERLHEQYTANVRLDVENLELKLEARKLELRNAVDLQDSSRKQAETKADNLQKFVNEIKSKYELSGEELKYDHKSGVIQ